MPCHGAVQFSGEGCFWFIIKELTERIMMPMIRVLVKEILDSILIFYIQSGYVAQQRSYYISSKTIYASERVILNKTSYFFDKIYLKNYLQETKA